jgi:hypothetical protein
MPKRGVPPKGSVQKVFRFGAPEQTPCAEEARAHRQDAFDIDELNASPWIGLHYRHEFLLHYSHELLEKHPKD